MNAYTSPHHLASSVAVAALSIPPAVFRIESPIGGTVATITVPAAGEAVEVAPEPAPVPVAPVSLGAILDRASLMAAVAVVGRAIEKRNTIPILSNVHIAASPTAHGVYVTGTDLDLTIRSFVACAVDHGFAVTVPAHALADVLKKAKAAELVTITDPGTHKHVSDAVTDIALDFDGLKVTLSGRPATDFPAPVWPDGRTTAFDMPAADLFRLIDRTSVAISTEETRYYLNGIFLHSLAVDGQDYLSAVATDGHRLAKCDVALPAGADPVTADSRPGVILPRKAADELHRALKAKGCPDTVSVRINPARIEVTIGGTVYDTETIDGTFPAYERVVPMGNDRIAVIPRVAMAEALAAVSTIKSDRGHAIRFSFEPSKLTLCMVNPDMGRAEMSVPITYEAGPLDIGFNSDYFAAVLAEFTGDTIRIAMNDSESPALFTDPAGDGCLMVLMPKRV